MLLCAAAAPIACFDDAAPSGGMAARAAAPTSENPATRGTTRPSRMSPRSPLPAAWIATPAPRNSNDLNTAWVTSWAPAAAVEPAPTATNISPYCADVEAARTRFACDCNTAVTPPARAVTIPTPATAGRNHPVGSRAGATRMRR